MGTVVWIAAKLGLWGMLPAPCPCPMVGWVPLRSCSRGTVGADFGSHFGCELEGVDSYPGETLSCGWVLGVRVPVVPGCKGGLRSVEEWHDLTIFSGNRKIWYFGHRLKTVQRGLFGQLDYKVESLCQSWKGEGHVGWARRHQMSGSGFCWC